uniref:Uncharacterized protein n=1 Tax=Anguilla anguilla TaxID=7936 RepID=A0A0E9W6K4_ANGAN
MVTPSMETSTTVLFFGADADKYCQAKYRLQSLNFS